jgi:hypothetical protein
MCRDALRRESCLMRNGYYLSVTQHQRIDLLFSFQRPTTDGEISFAAGLAAFPPSREVLIGGLSFRVNADRKKIIGSAFFQSARVQPHEIR